MTTHYFINNTMRLMDNKNNKMILFMIIILTKLQSNLLTKEIH